MGGRGAGGGGKGGGGGGGGGTETAERLATDLQSSMKNLRSLKHNSPAWKKAAKVHNAKFAKYEKSYKKYQTMKAKPFGTRPGAVIPEPRVFKVTIPGG